MRHAKVKGRTKTVIISYNEGDTHYRLLFVCHIISMLEFLSHQGMQIEDSVLKK